MRSGLVPLFWMFLPWNSGWRLQGGALGEWPVFGHCHHEPGQCLPRVIKMPRASIFYGQLQLLLLKLLSTCEGWLSVSEVFTSAAGLPLSQPDPAISAEPLQRVLDESCSSILSFTGSL